MTHNDVRVLGMWPEDSAQVHQTLSSFWRRGLGTRLLHTDQNIGRGSLYYYSCACVQCHYSTLLVSPKETNIMVVRS